MLEQIATMPAGIRLFLGYAFVILAIIGVSLPRVVALADEAPVTVPGLVLMALLAYTIFTTTLVLQRKEAARGLALGLASLTLPAIPLLLLYGALIQAAIMLVLAIALFRGLTRQSVRAYLSEP